MTDATSDAPEKDGRPRRTDWQNAFLTNFALHGIKTLAAKTVGVSARTVDRERQRDEDFAASYMEAYDEAADNLEQFAHRYATTGLETRTVTVKRDGQGREIERTERTEAAVNPTLMIFMLKAMRPKKFRENIRVEQTGANGGPLKLDLTVVEDVAAAARAELERLNAETDSD